MAYWGGGQAGGWSGGGFGHGGPGQALRRSTDGWADDDEYGTVYSQRVVSRLLPYLTPYKSKAVMAMIGMIIFTITSSFQPLLMGNLVDFAIDGKVGAVNKTGALFLALMLVSWGMQYVQLTNMGWIGHRVLLTLRTQMFDHMQRLSLRFYDNNEVGRVMSRVTSDVTTLQDLLTSGSLTIVANFLGATFDDNEDTRRRVAKLNALDDRAIGQFRSALDDARDAGVRALMLRGEGRAFCAGRDISDVHPETDDARGYLEFVVTPLLKQLSEFPAPTFAAAHGACLGVGLGLLVATDVVYIADTAKIGSPFANLGATLDSGGHALFFERLGAHRTLDLIYTAELMTGAEAVAAGLFSRAMPADELLEFTRARVSKVAAGATSAFLQSKRLIAGLRDRRIGLWKSISDENIAQGELCLTDDYKEGFAAFQQKRSPQFARL